MGDASVVEMVVVKVSPYLSANRPLLWLCEKETDSPRLLPIAIGQFEAAAIQMQLDREDPPRPISYDLLATMLSEAQIKMLHVVIHSVRKHTFYAKIVIDREHTIKEIDSRPSDAVALALRVDAPIFVSDELLDQAGLESMDDEPDVEHTMARFYDAEPQIVEKAGGTSAEQPEPVSPVDSIPPSDKDTPAHEAVPAAEEVEHADAGLVSETEEETESATAASGEELELNILQAKLEQAVLCEEYETAAVLRDQIELLLNKTKA